MIHDQDSPPIDRLSFISYLDRCPATPIKAPSIMDITAIIGAAFLSASDTIIMVGKASAKEMILPCNHHTIPGKSILTIMIETKKYCKNAAVFDGSDMSGFLVALIETQASNIFVYRF
jgi:hypothetical protein